MIVRELAARMRLLADRTLSLDFSVHGYAPLPPSLPEKNYDAWYFIEEKKPGVDAVNDDPR